MESIQDKTIHVKHGYDKNAYTYYPVLIVGAGETGIAMGCQLKAKLGFDQFRIFDRQSGVGGTWWINRYPGVAVDVPSALYSYSFDPYYDSDTIYPNGRKIVQYLHRVASKFQIVDKIQLNTDVSEIRWIEDENQWEATITYMAPGTGDMGEKDRQDYVSKHGRETVYLKQERVRAKIVISAIGGLVEPKSWPENIPGSQKFEGDMMHSARWKEEVSLKNKDVVVVGTGCSSTQIVQALLEKHDVKSITQLMRSPPWLQPKVLEPDRTTVWPKGVMDALTKYKLLGPIFRYMASIGAEDAWFRYFHHDDASARNRKKYEEFLLKRVRRIAPAKYHDMLVPDYPVGCKRRIFDPTPGWLDCMNDPRYTLTTQKLLNVVPEGITVSGNQTYPKNRPLNPDAKDEVIRADAIILANGYDTRDWLHPLKVIGKGGKSIHDVWKERGGPQAYMCCAMDGYPNLLILNGPNIYTGHHSVFFSSENMVVYALKMIKGILNGEVDTIEVKKHAELEWTARIQRELRKTVFASPECQSWYKTENNWNSMTYPRSQTEFMIRCFFPNWSHWNIALTSTGERRKRLRNLLKWTSFLTLIVGTFWARRKGTNLLQVIKTYLKDKLNHLLQIMTIALMQIQKRLQS